jgi:type IV secretory pathway TraG/TraD family ATPase VirD4
MTRRTSSTVLEGSGDLWTDRLLLAAGCAAVLAASGMLVWVAGTFLSWVTGHGPGLSPMDAAGRLQRGGSLGAVWPGIPTGAILALAVVLAACVVVLVMVVAGRWMAAHPPRDGFARTPQLAEVLPGRDAVRRARRLRPSLAGTRSPRPADLGVPLGRLERGRRPVRASWEDVVLAICAPRSGKTTSLAIPAVLDAPGPVVATSNKADLWQHTATVRAADTGQPVWTFDPQAVTGTDQGFVWSALDGVTTVAAARRLAGHFIQEIRRTADTADFWDRDAEDLLTALLLAAALDGQPLAQVGVWLTAVSSVEPRNILTRGGFTQLAQVMAGRSQGAHETREGVYATARAAAACLSDPQIMAWVTPRPGLPVFDPAAFIRARQTLYLLSKDGAGSAAPLVAASPTG